MPRQPSDSRLTQFASICRERGLPMTVQRHAILQAILGRNDHPTTDQIHSEIKTLLPGVSRTSVYRILELLVETGMITKVCHPGSAARFEPKLRRHHHLVCMSCERIIDLDAEGLNNLPLPDVRSQGFQISDYLIHFRGLCAECVAKEQPNTHAPRPVGRPKAGSKIKVMKQKRSINHK